MECSFPLHLLKKKRKLNKGNNEVSKLTEKIILGDDWEKMEKGETSESEKKTDRKKKREHSDKDKSENNS